MKKSLLASVAVLALVFAAPAMAQRDDNKDDTNVPRSHTSHDNDNTTPREENRERPPPTVSPSGTTGGANRGRPERSETQPEQPTGTMGTEHGTRHQRGTTTNTARPGETMRPSTRSGTMAPRTGRTGTATGTHVRNPKYATMRRTFTAPHRFHAGTYVQPSGFFVHHWTSGEFLPSFFFVQTYWILDWGDFALEAPIPGTIWVRVGDDALLIDEFTGEVIIVEYDVFF